MYLGHCIYEVSSQYSHYYSVSLNTDIVMPYSLSQGLVAYLFSRGSLEGYYQAALSSQSWISVIYQARQYSRRQPVFSNHLTTKGAAFGSVITTTRLQVVQKGLGISCTLNPSLYYYSQGQQRIIQASVSRLLLQQYISVSISGTFL